MTDAEYVFKQTSMERKRDGRGYYNKKRQGGKHVRLSSDALSKKEKEAMNGEVKTYRFREPVVWQDFIKMPDDIKQEYMDLLVEKFHGVPNALIAESMGCKQSHFSPFLCKHGIKFKNRPKVSPDKFLESEDGVAWKKWHENSRVKEPVEVKEEKPVEVIEEVPEEKEPEDNNIEKIIQMIRGLAGTGAKLTIEVTL